MPYVSFNSQGSRFVLAHDNTFFVYSVTPMEMIYRGVFPYKIKCIELLDTTQIMTVVYENKPNVLNVWDDQRKAMIAELETTLPIIVARIRTDYLLIATLNRVYVYTLFEFKNILVIETAYNVHGLLQITPAGKLLIATLGVNAQDILIRDVEEGLSKTYRYISGAHITPIKCIALSPDGKKVATSSEKGTVFRVYDISSGSMVKELRRGFYSTSIMDMTMTENVLVSISGTKTVHWYDIRNDGIGYFRESDVENYKVASEELASKQLDSKYACKIINDTDCLVLGNYGEYFLFRCMKLYEKSYYKDFP